MTGSRQMTNDGSVSISLRELMRLEEERVDRVRRDAVMRAEAEARARADAEQRVRDAENAAAYAERARREADAEREREIAARLDGIARAAVERARLEAQDAALSAQRTGQMRHVEELERLRQNDEKKRLRRVIAVLVVAAMAVLGGCFAFYALEMQPAAERMRAKAEADRASFNAAKENADKTSRNQQRKIDDLRRDIEAQKAAPPPSPATAAPPPIKAPTNRPPSIGVTHGDTLWTHSTNCHGDPLCMDK